MTNGKRLWNIWLRTSQGNEIGDGDRQFGGEENFGPQDRGIRATKDIPKDFEGQYLRIPSRLLRVGCRLMRHAIRGEGFFP